jgi:outer membrane receptor protein involved in Fe transport
MKTICFLLLLIFPLVAKPQDSTKTHQLKEINIVTTKPVIQQKIDRVTFNVANSVTASGGNAWDALAKAPGVGIGADNTITANHKDVMIYIDGRPTQLSGDDLVNYLQGLPADAVAQIEVYSNPPAKFDAQGSAVINIITKKSRQEGLNMTLNSSYIQGVYGGYSANAIFNYRKDKLNVYGFYGFAHKKVFTDHNVDIDYGSSFWESPNHNVNESDRHTYKLGADYQLTNNQVLGILITGSNRNGNGVGYTPTKVTSGGMLDSTLQTTTHTATGGNAYTYNLNYALKLDSGKHKINVDLDYAPYESSSNGYVDNITFLPDGSEAPAAFHIYTPATQHIDIVSGKADYETIINKLWTLTGGVKYSDIRSKSIFDFYDNSGKTQLLIPANGNHFNYSERTAAAYINANGTIGKLSLQGGLRAELTHTRGYSVTLDSLNAFHYLKLFPTVFAQYKMNDDHMFSLAYSSRVNRPEYALLNPARHYSSPYKYYVGNPGLQPEFTNSVELGYTYKGEHTITAYYDKHRNEFSNVVIQDNKTQEYYDSQQNLGLSTFTGLRVTSALHPADWWNVSLMAEGFYQRERSTLLQSHYDISKISYDGTLNQTFTIDRKHGMMAELNGMYSGAGIQGAFHFKQLAQVDFGIKSNVLNGKGTLRLAVNDIFNTFNYRVMTDYLDQHNSFFHRNESRNLTLSFTYRLGRDIAAARSRSTGSEEEVRRAQ